MAVQTDNANSTKSARRFRYEFFKLDQIDLKVASWIYNKHPKALYSYLEHTAIEYQKRAIQINVDKLYGELVAAMF